MIVAAPPVGARCQQRQQQPQLQFDEHCQAGSASELVLGLAIGPHLKFWNCTSEHQWCYVQPKREVGLAAKCLIMLPC